MTFNEIIVF